MPSHTSKIRRPMPLLSALACTALFASSTVIAQEVSGQTAASGSPVPKNISVSQAKLNGAAKDGA